MAQASSKLCDTLMFARNLRYYTTHKHMRWKPNLTIRSTLLLSIAVLVVVPVVGINFVWLRSQQRILRSDAQRGLAMQANFASVTIDTYIKEKVAKFSYYSDADGDGGHTPEELNNEFAELTRQDTDIVQLVMADRRGDVVASALSEQLQGEAIVSSANIFDEPAFKEVMFNNVTYYVGMPSYTAAGKSEVLMAVPVLSDETSGAATAAERVVVGVVRLDGLWEQVLVNRENANQSNYVVAKSGALLAHSQAARRTSASLSSVPAVQRVMSNAGDSGFALDGVASRTDGDQTLASVRNLPASGWSVITEEPLRSIDARANQLAQLVLIIDGIVLVLAVTLAAIVSRYLTSPLRSLANSARLIGELQFDVPLPVERRDELGVVARSFAAMGKQLKSSLGRVSAERNQFDVVINSIKDGIIVLDGAGSVRLANRACGEMLGVDEVLLKGHPYKELFSLYNGDKLMDVSLSQPGTETHTNVTLKTRFKSYVVDTHIAHLNIHSENIAAILTIIDRTKEQELETMKLDFVSIAAHELRTPITSVRGFIELLLNEFSTSYTPEVRNILRMMSSGSRQLISLVNNLLTVSKIERDQFNIYIESAEWTSIVHQVIDGHRYAASQQAVVIEFDEPNQPVTVAIDQVSMQEVLDNLLTNALQHAPRNSVVTVRVRQTPDYVITSVSDHGEGIPEEDQHKLFTKFYRVHGPLSSGSGGTGLGLFLAKSIVEMHKGKIWVESTKGAGSVFSFILPPYDEKFVRQNQAMSMYNEDKSTRKKRGWITKDITR